MTFATGRSPLEHLQHLGEACEIIKVPVWIPSVDFLGHHIGAEDIHTTMEDKLHAIVQAPATTNL